MRKEKADDAARLGGEAAWRRSALALIAAFALARIVLGVALGFGVDESYTIAISRRLNLSYFDHPPLHQWIAHFAALAFGENAAMRLPFIAIFAATGWLTYVLTRNLFGARAGVWATFALNASAFFFVSAGGWVVPDGPLLFALVAAAIAFANLFFDPRFENAAMPESAVWRLWLAGGFWLGIAGLSKYSAAFAAFGIVAFLALSPHRRRWFAHPAPYVAAFLCLALVTPVLVWNAENHWISFAFQGQRGASAAHWRPWQVAAMVLGQAAWITPWIFVPLVAALFAAARLARGDERLLFLLCLSLPAIAFFTVTPLWGARGLPHWPMPGWLFVYPLLGAWLAPDGAPPFNLRRWALASTVLLAAIATALVAQARTGWIESLMELPRGAVDPTLETLPWDGLKSSPLLGGEGAAAPAFVVSTKWSDGGKIALALGPATPVVVASDDPRGMAFLEDSDKFVGQDAIIVSKLDKLPAAIESLQPYFADLGAAQTLKLGRLGKDEIDLALIPAHRLTRPFALPYPR
jgi:4-amino-4-deoxy-L-arabinose transferase-like glycosyltransferase